MTKQTDHTEELHIEAITFKFREMELSRLLARKRTPSTSKALDSLYRGMPEDYDGPPDWQVRAAWRLGRANGWDICPAEKVGIYEE